MGIATGAQECGWRFSIVSHWKFAAACICEYMWRVCVSVSVVCVVCVVCVCVWYVCGWCVCTCKWRVCVWCRYECVRVCVHCECVWCVYVSIIIYWLHAADVMLKKHTNNPNSTLYMDQSYPYGVYIHSEQFNTLAIWVLNFVCVKGHTKGELILRPLLGWVECQAVQPLCPLWLWVCGGRR